MWPQFQRSFGGPRANQVNHVCITGQSLGIGAGESVVYTPVRYRNWMFNGQRIDGALFFVKDDDLNSLGLLFERTNSFDLTELGGETMAFAFGAYVSTKLPGHEVLVSNWARGASAYAALAKGTNPYARALSFTRYARKMLGNRHQFRAVLVIHGETDYQSATYDTDIRQWQVDMEGDGFAITQQTGRLPFFHTQISSWTCSLPPATTCVSPYKVLSEHVANPTKTVCVGPKYFLPFAGDGFHLTAAGCRWVAQYYAKAYLQHVVNGIQWEPLRPTSATLLGRVILVQFTGNVGPLVLDTQTITNPGSMGFEYTDNLNPPAIESVSVGGGLTVSVVLASVPTGASRRLRYAYTGVLNNLGGPTSGPRGCLRDSDPAIGVFGESLYNWCVHFDIPVV